MRAFLAVSKACKSQRDPRAGAIETQEHEPYRDPRAEAIETQEKDPWRPKIRSYRDPRAGAVETQEKQQLLSYPATMP